MSYYYKDSSWNLLHTYIDVHIQRLLGEYPVGGVQAITRLKSQCANVTFAENSRYNKLFQRVMHKGVESEMKYIIRFQNSKALVILVGNSYTKNQLMHTSLDNFQEGLRYYDQIARHKAELRREKNSCSKS